MLHLNFGTRLFLLLLDVCPCKDTTQHNPCSRRPFSSLSFLSFHLPFCFFCRFGPNPCGATGENGGYACGDYGYRDSFWRNQTFVQPDGSAVDTATAADVLAHFHAPPLSMHFAGIRKPRTYSNKELLRCETHTLLFTSAHESYRGRLH
jgi:hypothetical protein